MGLLLLGLRFGAPPVLLLRRLGRPGDSGQAPTRAWLLVGIAAVATDLAALLLLAGPLGLDRDAALLAGFGGFFAWQSALGRRDPGRSGISWESVGMGALGLLLIAVALQRQGDAEAAVADCRQRYAVAPDLADTLSTDRVVPATSPAPIGKYSTVMTCGHYRARKLSP